MNALVGKADFDVATTLRIASPGDFFGILPLCQMVHDEIGQHPYSEEKVKRLVWRAVSRDNAIMGVIGAPDDIRAMIMLTIDEVYYSSENQLYELWNFVRPDSRKSDFAKQLLQFAKNCSDALGIDLTIGIFTNDRLEAKARLYDRMFKQRAGVFYAYRSATHPVIEQKSE
jgi:GNAT superfamily N-acetyltransferase